MKFGESLSWLCAIATPRRELEARGALVCIKVGEQKECRQVSLP